MNKTEFWICDKCGEKIENIEDGWLEWLSIPDNQLGFKEQYMRIVHRVDCIYTKVEQRRHNGVPSDLDLKSFTGSDGLMRLLSFLSEDSFIDKEEVLEIIKRIHIPGYEEAREYFESAIYDGVFEPNTKPKYHSQIDIAETIKYKKKIDKQR